ncbi:TPA: DUF3265 domain-containing protein [Vibrio vulnificus]|nr:DUF3265 domain-containing protein [Vibrio vulnificus]
MHAAWHFWYAASFGDEGGLRKVGLSGIHPLTQRYAQEATWDWKLRSILTMTYSI